MAKTKPRLGFIGLGLMGSAMAEMLLADGYELAVWNLEPGPADLLAEKGAIPKSSPAEVARSSDVVLLCVLDTFRRGNHLYPIRLVGKALTQLVDERTASRLCRFTGKRLTKIARESFEFSCGIFYPGLAEPIG